MVLPAKSLSKKSAKETADQKAKVLQIAIRLSQKHRKALKNLKDK